MYQRHQNGRYRLRASFRITPDLIERVNAICARSGKDFGEVCRLAVERFVRVVERQQPVGAGAGGAAPAGGEAEKPRA